MRIGLHALGIGAGADPLVISAVARAAEHCGFATLWAGEHVVMVDRPDSTYPYADDGRIAVPSAADWLDPLDLLAFLSATTSTIRLATGVLLLPEHNPVVVAKRAATVDVLSGGRLTLGVGIGWSAEEFAALGVPFRGRGTRAEEYIDVLRALWRDDVASHTGSHVQFDRVRSLSEADPPLHSGGARGEQRRGAGTSGPVRVTAGTGSTFRSGRCPSGWASCARPARNGVAPRPSWTWRSPSSGRPQPTSRSSRPWG